MVLQCLIQYLIVKPIFALAQRSRIFSQVDGRAKPRHAGDDNAQSRPLRACSCAHHEPLGCQKYRVLGEFAHGQATRDCERHCRHGQAQLTAMEMRTRPFRCALLPKISSASRLTAGCCDALRLQVTSAWREDVYSPHLPLCEVRTETCRVESYTQEPLPQRYGIPPPDIPGMPFCNA